MATKIFQEVVRTVTVSYPIPFMLACLLGFALGCFGLAAVAANPVISGIILGTGCLSALAGAVSAGYAVLRKPELLRSERFNLMSRYMDMYGEDGNKADQRGLDQAMLTYIAEDVPKREVPPPGLGSTGGSKNEHK